MSPSNDLSAGAWVGGGSFERVHTPERQGESAAQTASFQWHLHSDLYAAVLNRKILVGTLGPSLVWILRRTLGSSTS